MVDVTDVELKPHHEAGVETWVENDNTQKASSKDVLSGRAGIGSSVSIARKEIIYIKLAHVFTYITMIFFLFFNIIILIRVVFVEDTELVAPTYNVCAFLRLFDLFAYTFGKTSMYIVLILRLKLVHFDTIANWKCKFNSVYFLTGMYCVLMSAFGLSIIVNMFTDNNDAITYTKICGIDFNSSKSRIPYFTSVPLAFFIDIIVQLFLLFEFVKPIYSKSNSDSNSNANGNSNDNSSKDDENKDIGNVAVKYSVLTSVAITSSLLNVVIVFLIQFTTGFAIDNCLNSLAIILMSSLHSNIYQKMCCCLHKPCMKCYQNRN